MPNDPPKKSPSPESLFQMILGGWLQQSISVVAKLGVPDLLKDGPKNHEELAVKTGTHSPTLYRLLRALSGVGLFQELDENGKAFTSTFGIRIPIPLTRPAHTNCLNESLGYTLIEQKFTYIEFARKLTIIAR